MFGVFSPVSRSECCLVLKAVIKKSNLGLRVDESGCVPSERGQSSRWFETPEAVTSLFVCVCTWGVISLTFCHLCCTFVQRPTDSVCSKDICSKELMREDE